MEDPHLLSGILTPALRFAQDEPLIFAPYRKGMVLKKKGSKTTPNEAASLILPGRLRH